MKLVRAARSGVHLLRARLLRHSIPVAVSWRLVNRCNLRCRYCHVPLNPAEELTTAEVLGVLDYLQGAGCQGVSFTGGEVLLREDVGEVVAGAADRGLLPSINSNGILVPRKLQELRRAGRLTLSLDGPEDVHDAVRGRGSHRQVLAALEAASGAGIPLALTAVLSRGNLQCVDYLLEMGARFRAPVGFQPGRLKVLAGDLANPEAPELDAYVQLLDRLVALKKEGHPWLSSSVTGLRHLRHFPAQRAIPCAAGRLYFRIEANGDVLPCVDMPDPPVLGNIRRDGPEAAFARARPVGCSQCWCARLVEFNYAFALEPGAVINLAFGY